MENKRLKSCLILMFFVVFLIMVGNGFAEPDFSPGTVIGPDNWEEYKQYIPSTAIIEKGFKKGRSIAIVKHPIAMLPPKAFRDATEKYGPGCKLESDGSLSNYLGGFPFTSEEIEGTTDAATKGLKIAWNFTQRWFGDEFISLMGSGMEDSANFTLSNKTGKGLPCRRICQNKRGDEVISDQTVNTSLCMGRVSLAPMPNIPGREGILRTRLYSILNPRDIAGQMVLYYEYMDPLKNDDLWLYIPSIRRVKRMPTSQRAATRSPADYTWDDGNGWSGKVASFNWKLLDERKVLAPIEVEPSFKYRQKGEDFPTGLGFQLVDAYTLECIPKDPNYSVPKKVFTICKSNYQFMYETGYNKRGEEWKLYVGGITELENKNTGEKSSYGSRFNVWDLLSDHCTIMYTPATACNFKRDHKIYTIQYLYEGSRGVR